MTASNSSIEMTGLKNELWAMEKFLNRYDIPFINNVDPNLQILITSSKIIEMIRSVIEFICEWELTSISMKIY